MADIEGTTITQEEIDSTFTVVKKTRERKAKVVDEAAENDKKKVANKVKKVRSIYKDFSKLKQIGTVHTCTNCNKQGHISKYCPQEKKPRNTEPSKEKNEQNLVSSDIPKEISEPKKEVREKSSQPLTCFNCKKEGHFIKDCTEEKKPRNKTSDSSSESKESVVKRTEKPICYNCNKEGHVAKYCKEEKKPRKELEVREKSTQPLTCHNCKKEGHFIKDCTEEKKPRNKISDSSSESKESVVKPTEKQICYNCDKEGHVAKYCKEEKKPRNTEKKCRKCDQVGHVASLCPLEPAQPKVERTDRPLPVCHNCNLEGHISRNCRQERTFRNTEKTCYTCGQPGHISATCTSESSTPREEKVAPQVVRSNKNHEEGQVSRDCPTRKPVNVKKCFICDQSGHFAYDCPDKLQNRV